MGSGLAQGESRGRRFAGRARTLRSVGSVGSVAVLLALAAAAALWLPACASRPAGGFYHTVRSGENLYRIGRRYSVPHAVLGRVNKIRDETRLAVGTRLWIPRRGGKLSAASLAKARDEARRHATWQARNDARLSFKWPLKGRLTSRFGMRSGRLHEGIDLAAPRGSPVRAAEAGKVIHSGRLGAYGRCVIVKHAGSYRSVYAHATKLLVRKGQFVDRGQKIATVGSTGRATGAHLHFEIRRRETPRDPMLYLP